MNWKDMVREPDEVKVFEALDCEPWTWRTIGGVARQAGLTEPRVQAILDKYDLVLTQRSEVPSASGSRLVGLLERAGV